MNTNFPDKYLEDKAALYAELHTKVDKIASYLASIKDRTQLISEIHRGLLTGGLDDFIIDSIRSKYKINLPNVLNSELVPRSSWGANLKNIFDREDWDVIRKFTYRNASLRCEVCGGQGGRLATHPVEAHEVWGYRVILGRNTQVLERTISLCPDCHMLGKHIGFANVQGRGEEVRPYLQKVNGWTSEQAKQHINFSFDQWLERSEIKWDLDISWVAIRFPKIAEKYCLYKPH